MGIPPIRSEQNTHTSTPLSMRKHLNPFTPATIRDFKSVCYAATVSREKPKRNAKKKSIRHTHLVPWNYTAPKSDICPTLTPGCFPFLLEVIDGGRGWDGVERHIYDGCDTSRDSCSRTCPESFPVCATWFVQMNVSTGKVEPEVSVSQWRPYRIRVVVLY